MPRFSIQREINGKRAECVVASFAEGMTFAPPMLTTDPHDFRIIKDGRVIYRATNMINCDWMMPQ